MKMALVVHNEFFTPRVMQLLKDSGIDYYTRWDHATGKGHGTDPHTGSGSFGSTNAVLMIGFHEDGPLEDLITRIAAANQEITRPDDKVRLFQMPLERII
jgi:hypothetical protein